jgi:hypothetical protein
MMSTMFGYSPMNLISPGKTLCGATRRVCGFIAISRHGKNSCGHIYSGLKESIVEAERHPPAFRRRVTMRVASV